MEPVQLQIACLHLWVNLPQEHATILLEDIQRFGDVDRALTNFYSAALAEVVKKTGVAERRLRLWFDENLIAPDHSRSLVYRGETESSGVPNAAVDILCKYYVIRAIPRGNDVWYELTHDRLVAPVLADNAAWRQENLGTLQRQAALWEKEGRPGGLLLREEELEKAEKWADTHSSEMEPHEIAFLKVCQEARETARKLAEETEARHKAEEKARIEAEQRAEERFLVAKKLRIRLWIAIANFSIALGLFVVATYLWKEMEDASQEKLYFSQLGRIYATEKAQQIDPSRDSRGLARALTGDYRGAIADFKAFIEWSKKDPGFEEHRRKRESWIEALEAGKNPFDKTTLEALSKE